MCGERNRARPSRLPDGLFGLFHGVSENAPRKPVSLAHGVSRNATIAALNSAWVGGLPLACDWKEMSASSQCPFAFRSHSLNHASVPPALTSPAPLSSATFHARYV